MREETRALLLRGSKTVAGTLALAMLLSGYSAAGVVASIPDVVFIDVTSGDISVVEGLQRVWDPDPRT